MRTISVMECYRETNRTAAENNAAKHRTNVHENTGVTYNIDK